MNVFLLLLVCLLPAASQGQEELIPGGSFKPLYTVGPRVVRVESFYLDRDPVTNQDFLAFVKANPRWRRSRVARVFAEERYLKNWSSDLQFRPELAGRPVTEVSWFAARAYCRWRGKRLPTEAEWEYVGRASATQRDASQDKAFIQGILDWYARPTPALLPPVSAGKPNAYGVRGMHGMIWEWVEDFNTSLVTGESRGDKGLDRNLFCAAGVAGSGDPSNYAAYMRYAFRASLQARFTTRNLGFRCARDSDGRK